MAASFSVSQIYGAPEIVIITDTSTGLSSVASRRVYISTYNGVYLVPSGVSTQYTPFPISANSINIDCLDKDYALSILCQWLDNSNVVLYTSTQLVGVTSYNEEFLYGLTEDQSGDPTIIQDTNYYSNKSKMREDIDSGNQAISLANDLAGAQLCYDKATYLRINQNIFF